MLVRVYRVTDRLGNAFLRISAWGAMTLLDQATSVRQAVAGFIGAAWTNLRGATTTATRNAVTAAQVAVDRAQTTSRSARQAYEATTTRRHQHMVQRAQEAQYKPAVAEDPLRGQNRALSAFAVLLLLALLAVVIFQTTGDNDDTTTSGGVWPEAQNTPRPTAFFPTAIPTITPIPDPLREGGSLVFTLHDKGQDDLWAISVGESGPLRLTNDLADDRDPAWSPDGNQIAFTSHRDGNWELYLLQINNGAITRLTYTPGFEGAPSWSPDGAFIAYEGYNSETENLDIYIISADPVRAAAEGAIRVTYAAGPDIEPDWSPQGRHIAYVSTRTGSKDIFLLDLDNPSEDVAVNLTHTPDIDESFPTWSPDSSTVAYSAVLDGKEGVYVKPAQQPESEPVLVGRGRMPAWAPNGSSIAYTFTYGRQTQILAGTIGNFGAATDAIALPELASDPDWTAPPLPPGFVDSGGLPANPALGAALYTENATRQDNGLYGLAPLNNVEAPQPYLSDRVNESFEALRLRVLEKTGFDFLGTLQDAFWPQDRPPEPGEPGENWHYAGRTFALNRDLIYEGPPVPLVIVREDVEVNTYWRVFVRVTGEAQNGALGEPLRDLPWDFTARSSGDVGDYERGGRVMDIPPAGYYVDLTQIADDYGWQRVSAVRTWQFNFGAIQYWEFVKTNGLSWNDAMLELYTPGELANFLAEETSIPAPPPLPTESPTPERERTATPIPPDVQQ